MKTRKIIAYCLIFASMTVALAGCGISHRDDMKALQSAPEASRGDVRVRVADVSNKTGRIFDVDAIGMLWTGLDESLKHKGLLATGGQTQARLLTLDARITDYRPGNLALKVVPYFGKTVLAVKCELKDGNTVVATAESKREIGMTNGGLITFSAWRKIFSEVSQDLVDQLARKI